MSSPLTLLFAISSFTDSSIYTMVTPNEVTRFAFMRDEFGAYTQVEISSQTGPQDDDKVDIIDVAYMAVNEIDITDFDCALIVRMESTGELSDEAIQAIGRTIESYMDQNGASQFATAAIHDIGQGQELFGRWNTVVFARDYEGKWTAKDLGFTSVQRSANGAYAILKDGRLAKTDANPVSTLLDNDKLQALLDDGYTLQGTKRAHLVRPPIGQTFAVVSDGKQVVYDENYQVLGSNQTNFTTMQAIDVDGTPLSGHVTTVSGRSNNWDIRPGISASKAGNLAQAYGAAAV